VYLVQDSPGSRLRVDGHYNASYCEHDYNGQSICVRHESTLPTVRPCFAVELLPCDTTLTLNTRTVNMGQQYSTPSSHLSFVLFQFLTRNHSRASRDGSRFDERSFHEEMASRCWDELLDACEAAGTLLDQCLRNYTCLERICPFVERFVPIMELRRTSGASGAVSDLNLTPVESSSNKVRSPTFRVRHH
jgi:hypothetical protein